MERKDEQAIRSLFLRAVALVAEGILFRIVVGFRIFKRRVVAEIRDVGAQHDIMTIAELQVFPDLAAGG